MAILSAVVLTLAGACSSHSAGNPRTSAASRPSPSSSAHGASIAGPSTPTAAAPTTGPASMPGHVVVVMMENRSYSDVIGNHDAPYLSSLVQQGRSLTHMYAITHPSQPNYLALFSGSTQGITDDSCPQTLSGTNLARELLDAHLTFAGYSEALPKAGDPTCDAGSYARKHAPWTDFADLPSTVHQPFSAFPTDYATLPTLSFVIPDLDHDMHDGTIAQGDQWLAQHLGGYARWAASNDSLLVITWDEDDHSEQNQIPTIIDGAGITPGSVPTRFTLYSLLRGIEDVYGLPRLGASAGAQPVPLS